jgi:hypothetical protein
MQTKSTLLLALVIVACSQAKPVDLSIAVRGMPKQKFLACSGPPSMEFVQAGQDQMAFVTNLKRGQQIGIGSTVAIPTEACSVNATFVQDRLTNATFSGNQSMCELVFGPCLGG